MEAPEGQLTLDTIPMMLEEDLEWIYGEFRISRDFLLEILGISDKVTTARRDRVAMHEEALMVDLRFLVPLVFVELLSRYYLGPT